MARTINRLFVGGFFMAAVACGSGCDRGPEAPVRATLADGQVLYGSLQTTTLSLEGGMGTLDIPLAHVGEVIPVEGTQLGDSDGYVNVMLRNGSELAGKWHDPELAVGILVGGEEVKVDLPAEDLARLQTQGNEIWPDAAVYRVSTTHGDDFLVDASASRLVLTNGLGTFSPFLSECRSARPIGDADGEWRVELESGTVLVGNLADDALTLALPMGPGEVTVPLAILVSMEQQQWYVAASTPQERTDRAGPVAPRTSERRGGSGGWYPWGQSGEAAEEGASEQQVVDAEVAMDMPSPAPDGDWFHRDRLEATKQLAD